MQLCGDSWARAIQIRSERSISITHQKCNTLLKNIKSNMCLASMNACAVYIKPLWMDYYLTLAWFTLANDEE